MRLLYWAAAARGRGVLGQLAILMLLTGAFAGVSFLPSAHSAHWGIPAATAGWLQVLWQVQATSVGLVLALAVFVFGLLPQGRGRLPYREFLRRTWALPLTVFNVASLLFSGMVLLGLGRQVPGAKTASDNHGWAVSMASVVAMVAIGSIVVILARALSAIDPALAVDVERRYQYSAVSLKVRSELVELESLQMLKGKEGKKIPCEFSTGPTWGLTVYAQGPEGRVARDTDERFVRVVRDVSLWGLRVLGWLASRRRQAKPVVHVWPGKRINSRTPLVTIDASCSRLESWWARRCVRLGRVPQNPLDDALRALHGEVLEHIRAGRPTEASVGLHRLGILQKMVWQGYAAHDRTWKQSPEFPEMGVGAGNEIWNVLGLLLLAAAVSGDDTVRQRASEVPVAMAIEALDTEVPEAVRLNLLQLGYVYAAVANEVSDGGQRELPVTGVARRRLTDPFAYLLSFVEDSLGTWKMLAVDNRRSEGWTGGPLPPAGFLLYQLNIANEVMLAMLRAALVLRDGETVRQVLDEWKLPWPAFAADWTWRAADGGGRGDTVLPRGFAQSAKDDAQADLDAMLLRLLASVVAVRADRSARRPAPADGALGGSSGDRKDADLAVNAILERLPKGRLWDTLDRARKVNDDGAIPYVPDGGLQPHGYMASLRASARMVPFSSRLQQAFALAAIARPELTEGAEPGLQLALDCGKELIDAVSKVEADQILSLLRDDCAEQTVARRAAGLTTRLELAISAAESWTRWRRVQPGPMKVLCDAARESFGEHDVTGALFAWAGPRGPKVGPESIEVSLTADRSLFTDTVGTSKLRISYEGRLLGRRLARSTLHQLRRKVPEAVPEPVGSDSAADAVRTVIANLSRRPYTPTRQLAAPRVAVLIPGALSGLRDELEKKGTVPQQGAKHARELRALGVYSGTLDPLDDSFITGTIDGALIVKTDDQDPDVVMVIDFARFGTLHRDAQPELRWLEPADYLRVAAGSASGKSGHPAESLPADPLKVQATLSLAGTIKVGDLYAVLALRIG